MLRVEDLTVRAGSVPLVTDFSCALREGRITCLIGPSGYHILHRQTDDTCRRPSRVHLPLQPA
ncbi:hypothetical protein [Roseovarius sp. M141]|uniref:hypothetical protein n=1 Tax=Roseovarius sp. M141 TaxID=2583806 RepID=UPI0020CD2843|nr:hypothetical protein [Roseovarius sp. M141]MCQ0090648.1 hypothetical protein [Roseovarius sp. M141]